jgi:hypothetical protein
VTVGEVYVSSERGLESSSLEVILVTIFDRREENGAYVIFAASAMMSCCLECLALHVVAPNFVASRPAVKKFPPSK